MDDSLYLEAPGDLNEFEYFDDELDDKMYVEFLGYNVPYLEGMKHMRECIALASDPKHLQQTLLLLEHKPTITTTRLHGRKNLLVDDNYLSAQGIEIVETDRGGDITYHGPGQLVGYPVLFIGNEPIVDYVRDLERAIIEALEMLGLYDCFRIDNMTGVWIRSGGQDKKLAAIGVGVSNGVTKHGFALNVSTDLAQVARCIVPCGLKDKGITNLSTEFKKHEKKVPTWLDICNAIIASMSSTFDCEPQFGSELYARLGEHNG